MLFIFQTKNIINYLLDIRKDLKLIKNLDEDLRNKTWHLLKLIKWDYAITFLLIYNYLLDKKRFRVGLNLIQNF